MTADEIRTSLACGHPDCSCAHPKSRVTHCPAHADRRPSFGVDEDGGHLLVHCRAGCRQTEVFEALRSRGLWAGAPITVNQRSPEQAARRMVLSQERRRRTRLAAWFERYRQADEDRWCDQLVAHARFVATTLGDTDEAWRLLEAAADLDRLILNG